MNKMVIAHEIKTQVDLIYGEMTNGSKNAMSYLDACKLTGYVEHAFLEKTGGIPENINANCSISRGLLNPDEIGKKNDISKGFGLLLTAAGGLGLTWGILLALSFQSGIWAFIVACLVGSTVPILGPIAIAAGAAAIASGIYVAIKLKSPTELSALVHSMLIKAIDAWADEKAAEKKDEEALKDIQAKAKEEVKA
jgi:hypothetical protein